MEGNKRRRRLGEQAWRELLDRFDSAGVSVADFCRREGVGQASFYSWRGRLRSTRAAAGLCNAAHRQRAPFVDLGSLASSSTSRLDLKLDLGGGLMLHLVRS